MAHGRQVEFQPPFYMTWALLEAAPGVEDGVWVEAKHFRDFGAVIENTGGASVQICASNAKDQPAPEDHGVGITLPTTASGLLALHCPVRWLKARVLQAGTQPVTVMLHGRN